jgi:hypothetical protein
MIPFLPQLFLCLFDLRTYRQVLVGGGRREKRREREEREE